jgi:hypothetical protein
MDHEYDPNEAMPDVDEPEPLPTAYPLTAICAWMASKDGFEAGFTSSERFNGFAFVPWEPDIAINFMGSEFILSLRPSNRIV